MQRLHDQRFCLRAPRADRVETGTRVGARLKRPVPVRRRLQCGLLQGPPLSAFDFLFVPFPSICVSTEYTKSSSFLFCALMKTVRLIVFVVERGVGSEVGVSQYIGLISSHLQSGLCLFSIFMVFKSETTTPMPKYCCVCKDIKGSMRCSTAQWKKETSTRVCIERKGNLVHGI